MKCIFNVEGNTLTLFDVNVTAKLGSVRKEIAIANAKTTGVDNATLALAKLF